MSTRYTSGNHTNYVQYSGYGNFIDIRCATLFTGKPTPEYVAAWGEEVKVRFSDYELKSTFILDQRSGKYVLVASGNVRKV